MAGEKRGSLEVLKTTAAQAAVIVQQVLPGLYTEATPFEEHYGKAKMLLATGFLHRNQMPVIDAEDYNYLKQFLGNNARTERVERNPLHLKPLQSQVYLSKLIDYHKVNGFPRGTAPILVSGDSHIIDGHHRWLDSILLGKHIPAFEIGLTAQALFLMSVGLSDVEKHARNA